MFLNQLPLPDGFLLSVDATGDLIENFDEQIPMAVASSGA